MSRQKLPGQESKGAKRCSLCGAKMWMYDDMRYKWLGPYHFQDCIEVPGGEELMEANFKDKMEWEEEEYIPREKGRKLLQMVIDVGKGLPEDRERRKKILAERKALIHQEITDAMVPF